MSRSFGNHLSFSVNHGGELKNKRLNINFVFFVASCSLGAAQASLDLAVDYLKVRKQFGKPLSSFQVTSNSVIVKLKDLYTHGIYIDPSRKKKVAEIRILSFLIINYMTKLYA